MLTCQIEKGIDLGVIADISKVGRVKAAANPMATGDRRNVRFQRKDNVLTLQRCDAMLWPEMEVRNDNADQTGNRVS